MRNIPRSWKQGHDDAGARKDLRATLYRVSAEQAGTVVAGFLGRGISPDAIWQVLFDMAAELIMRQSSIVLLHAQTTANALHYAYRVCGNEQTQQLMLLQCGAFMAMFREMTEATRPDLSLEALQPLPLEGTGAEAIGEIFSGVRCNQGLQRRGARRACGARSYLRPSRLS